MGERMAYSELMELTPKQIWWLFHSLHKKKALDRLLSVSDLKAVVSSALSKDGHEHLQSHIKALVAQADS